MPAAAREASRVAGMARGRPVWMREARRGHRGPTNGGCRLSGACRARGDGSGRGVELPGHGRR